MGFDTERFIEEIEKRPCLWNNRIKDYSNRKLRTKCWDELVDIFKENDDITIGERKAIEDVLQKKWKNIRGCYTREICRKKMLNTGSCKGRKSEYIFFQQLKFLNKSSLLMREPNLDSSTDEETSKRNSNVNSTKSKKKRKKSEEIDTFYEEALNKSIASREKHDTINQDADRLFMLSLVATLKKVPEHKKIATKIKIMSVLDEATRNWT